MASLYSTLYEPNIDQSRDGKRLVTFIGAAVPLVDEHVTPKALRAVSMYFLV